MAKGPLTTTDMIVFHAGGYGFVPYAPCSNRIAYQNRQRIAPFYVKNEHGIPDVAQRVHWDSAWAQAIGNPMAYDYGVDARLPPVALRHRLDGRRRLAGAPEQRDPQVQLRRRRPRRSPARSSTSGSKTAATWSTSRCAARTSGGS